MIKNQLKNNFGITLIALVVIIIIISIMGGVLINISLGNIGLFGKAKTGVEEYKVSAAKEKLELSKTALVGTNYTLNEYIETIAKEKIIDRDNVVQIEEHIVDVVIDGLVFRITDDANEDGIPDGIVSYIYVSAVKDLQPEILIKDITTTTGTIKVDVKTRYADDEKYEYYIKKVSENESEFKKDGEQTTSKTHTYSNLIANENYTVKVVLKVSGKSNSSVEQNVKTVGMQNLQEAEIIFETDKNSWTNTDVEVTVSINNSAIQELIDNGTYKIQTKLNNGSFEDTNKQTATAQNDVIGATVTDGYGNYAGAGTHKVTIIDKEKPNDTAPTLVSKTTKTINVQDQQQDVVTKVNEDDVASGLKNSEKKFRLTNSEGTTGTWQSTGTFDNLTSGTYYVQTYAKDEAGNDRTSQVLEVTLNTVENAAGGSCSPTTMTNGNVTVTLTTKTGFTTRYTTDGTTPNKNSTQYTGPFTVPNNCVVKYIYTDGVNVGEAGTINIENIDKTAPTISNVSTSNNEFYDTITFKASDSASKVKYYAVTRNNSEPTDWVGVKQTDLTGVQIKQQHGATWARVFWHNCDYGAQQFTSNEEALSTNSTYKYSILNRLEEFRDPNGKFEFLLEYPSSHSKYNRWKQTDNPATVTIPDGNPSATANGYEAIHIDMDENYWGGLTKSTSSSTFIDGTVGHGNWFYAIGCKTVWENGIPGNDSPGILTTVELWVRIDDLTETTMNETTITINAYEGEGDYYIWAKDSVGNISSQKVTLSNTYFRDTKYVEKYSATWTKVFYHNCKSGTVLFTNKQEALSINTKDKYSVLDKLERIRRSGKFEFLLEYPSDTTQYNRWIQTDNPATVTETNGNGSQNASGYQAVHIDWNTHYWGGLLKSTTGETFIDGSVGHSNWYFAIGSISYYSPGIPSYDGTANDVVLYVRIK